MTSFYDSLREGFTGNYMAAFKASLVADTEAVAEFIARDFATSVMYVAGRMVDQAQEMVDAWRKVDTGTPRAKPKLPVLLVCVAKDYEPAPPEFSARASANAVDVRIPGDTLNRVLKLKTITQHKRVQVVILAAEEQTAHSLAVQFHSWASQLENRRFNSPFELAGVMTDWPVTIEDPDIVGLNVDNDQRNLTIKAFNLSLMCAVPVVYGPTNEQPNDGQGDGTYQNPHGAPLVNEADATQTTADDLTVDTAKDITFVVNENSITPTGHPPVSNPIPN